MCYFMRDTVLSHYYLLFEGDGQVVYKLLKQNKRWMQAHTHEHTRGDIQHEPVSDDEI